MGGMIAVVPEDNAHRGIHCGAGKVTTVGTEGTGNGNSESAVSDGNGTL